MRPATYLLLGLLVSAAPVLAAEPAMKAPPKTPNVVGKPITEARALLLEAGWKPRPTYLPFDDDRFESQWGEAGGMYESGMVEIEMCAGTGVNPCIFNYQRGKQCLRVFTQGEFKQGEYEPEVVAQRRECPPKEALRDPPE